MKAAVAKIGHVIDRIPPRWQFAAFLAGSLLITVVLTVVSYSLYLISGTAQLDLSRPGYKQALSEVAPTDTDDSTYSSTGPLDNQALTEFQQKYNALIGKTNDYSAFAPSALSDEQLNLDGDNPSVNGAQ